MRTHTRPAVRLGADRDASVQQREGTVTASSYPRQDDGSGRRPRVDAGRLWTGGLASAVVAALVATGLMHLLLVSTPRPFRFFAWIVALLVLVAVLAPFTTGASLDTKVATAVINLAIGLAIGSLVPGVARSAVRLGSGRPPPAGF